MVVHGYAHLSAKFRLLSVEMKILNDWVNEMPGLLANDGATIPDDEQLINAIDEFVASGDALTDSMVENALSLELMTKAINFQSKYGPTTM